MEKQTGSYADYELLHEHWHLMYIKFLEIAWDLELVETSWSNEVHCSFKKRRCRGENTAVPFRPEWLAIVFFPPYVVVSLAYKTGPHQLRETLPAFIRSRFNALISEYF